MLDTLLQREGVTLTPDQDEALRLFFGYLKEGGPRNVFLLTGSAGTGKTFMIQLFRQVLKQYNHEVMLLAPTGQAAKVVTRRTQRLAYTIHHHIYSPMESGFGGDVRFMLKPNKETRSVAYLVDEASMIGDQIEGTSSRLLTDLMEFVFDEDSHRKLILVGDPVQLPPVGLAESPALSPELLRKQRVGVTHAHLHTVLRQEADSGILENAVRVRDAFLSPIYEDPEIVPSRDVMALEGMWEGIEEFVSRYDRRRPDQAVMLTYSNAFATKLNQQIRYNLYEEECPIREGDLVVVMRNNYAWGDKKRFPFIANGELGRVTEVFEESREKRYGLEWMDLTIEFTDAGGEPYHVTAKAPLDLLNSKETQLQGGVMDRLQMERRDELSRIHATKGAFLDAVRTDPYLQALQIKYGYAMTVHKSQGGQWETAIVAFERDYGNDPQAYLRWTYTAITRAASRLGLVGCPFVRG